MNDKNSNVQNRAAHEMKTVLDLKHLIFEFV